MFTKLNDSKETKLYFKNNFSDVSRFFFDINKNKYGNEHKNEKLHPSFILLACNPQRC